MEENNKAIKRRDYLKSLSAVAGVGALPVVQADESLLEKFKQGLRLRRDQNWSIGRWYDYVGDLGIMFGNSRSDITTFSEEEKTSGSGVTTDDFLLFEEDDITLTMTYYLGPPATEEDWVELHWEFDTSWSDSYTGEPKDAVKIGYPPEYYDKPSNLDGDSMYHLGSEMVEPAGVDGYTNRGMVAKYNGIYFDGQNPLIGDGELGGDLDRKDWMSVAVTPKSGTDEDRTLYFGYSMIYENAEFAGTTIDSSGAIGVSIDNESDSWTVNIAYEEEDIRSGKEYTP